MLGKLNKIDLAARAKKMKEAAQALPTEDLKLRAVVEATLAPTDDEKAYSWPVFKRRRNSATEPSKHSVSDERAPSLQAPPPSPPPFRDMVVVQEDEGTSAPEAGLWDPNLDAPPFLEKTLMSVKNKEKLDSLKKDHLVEQAVRLLGQALAANYIAISKLMGGKD